MLTFPSMNTSLAIPTPPLTTKEPIDDDVLSVVLFAQRIPLEITIPSPVRVSTVKTSPVSLFFRTRSASISVVSIVSALCNKFISVEKIPISPFPIPFNSFGDGPIFPGYPLLLKTRRGWDNSTFLPSSVPLYEKDGNNEEDNDDAAVGAPEFAKPMMELSVVVSKDKVNVPEDFVIVKNVSVLS